MYTTFESEFTNNKTRHRRFDYGFHNRKSKNIINDHPRFYNCLISLVIVYFTIWVQYHLMFSEFRWNGRCRGCLRGFGRRIRCPQRWDLRGDGWAKILCLFFIYTHFDIEDWNFWVLTSMAVLKYELIAFVISTCVHIPTCLHTLLYS